MIDISGQFAIQSAEQLVIMLLVMMKELNYLYHLVDFVLMKIQLSTIITVHDFFNLFLYNDYRMSKREKVF